MFVPSHLNSNEIKNDLEFEWLLCLASGLQSFQRLLPAGTAHILNESRAIKRIFQIAYTEQLRIERAELLRRLGYAVISVIGNEAAQVLLSANPHNGLALFIVGHAASERTRTEMIDWLKEKYPKVKVLALNPPNSQLPRADYNATQNRPENWLPFVSTL
jgi:hypothetical protein